MNLESLLIIRVQLPRVVSPLKHTCCLYHFFFVFASITYQYYSDNNRKDACPFEGVHGFVEKDDRNNADPDITCGNDRIKHGNISSPESNDHEESTDNIEGHS